MQSFFDKVRRRPAVRIPALFLVACVLAFILEHYVEALTAESENHPGLTQSIFNVRVVYQYLVASWPRRLVPRHTVLVAIDPERDPTAVWLYNICDQREFLAQLITALAEREPKIIVVDKFFTVDGCKPPDHPSTAKLQEAIATVASRVPIIVGIRIDKRRRSSRHLAWPIESAVNFPDAREGVINSDKDFRRLAFGWTIQRNGKSEPEWSNTLALEAAQAYEPELVTRNPSLQQLIENRDHPYLSFIRREDWKEYLAGEILCAFPEQRSSMPDRCEPHKTQNQKDLQYLRGRIAMVGEISQDLDQHFTVIGRVPGFILQANYIEALLDERYFKPMPSWVDYLIGFLFFVGVEAALHQRSALRCFAYVIAVTAFTLLLLFLTVRHFGYYINPVTVSALVLGLKLIFWLFERIVQKGEARHEA